MDTPSHISEIKRAVHTGSDQLGKCEFDVDEHIGSRRATVYNLVEAISEVIGIVAAVTEGLDESKGMFGGMAESATQASRLIVPAVEGTSNDNAITAANAAALAGEEVPEIYTEVSAAADASRAALGGLRTALASLKEGEVNLVSAEESAKKVVVQAPIGATAGHAYANAI